jgi:hypothetical protein
MCENELRMNPTVFLTVRKIKNIGWNIFASKESGEHLVYLSKVYQELGYLKNVKIQKINFVDICKEISPRFNPILFIQGQ